MEESIASPSSSSPSDSNNSSRCSLNVSFDGRTSELNVLALKFLFQSIALYRVLSSWECKILCQRLLELAGPEVETQ